MHMFHRLVAGVVVVNQLSQSCVHCTPFSEGLNLSPELMLFECGYWQSGEVQHSVCDGSIISENQVNNPYRNHSNRLLYKLSQ